MKSRLENDLMIWKEFEKDLDKMNKFLNDLQQDITSTIGKGIDIHSVGIEREMIKVCTVCVSA